MISVDAQRLLERSRYLTALWGAPLQVIVAMYLVYQRLGYISVLFGCLGLIVLLPPNLIGGKIVEKLQSKQLQKKDLRIKVFDNSLLKFFI